MSNNYAWNNLQKDIWLKLVSDNAVHRDDLNTFFEFGQFFSDYFEQHRDVAPYQIILHHFIY